MADQSLSVENDRQCRHCGSFIKTPNPKARYCSMSCRVMACQERKRWRARLNSASRSLEGCAPPQAASYRLSSQRPLPWACFNFDLQPFEPPRVSHSGIYKIEYFDAAGRNLGTPYALAMGIFVKAFEPTGSG